MKQFFTSTFQGINVSLSGFFYVNSTSKTLQGTILVKAVNTTSGMVLISVLVIINLAIGSTSNIRVLFLVPSTPLALAVPCTINPATNKATCFTSRDPDINHDGVVNIIDAAILGAAYGTVTGSPRYNPAADLDANGVVDIIDASILGAYFGAPLLA